MRRKDETANANAPRLVVFVHRSRRAIFCTLLLAMAIVVLSSSRPSKSSGGSRMIGPPTRPSSMSSRRISKLFGSAGLSYKTNPLLSLTPKASAQLKFRERVDNDEPLPEGELLEHEEYWAIRLTYPTGNFDPQWVREAIDEDTFIDRAIPGGFQAQSSANQNLPQSLNPNSFTPIGPSPERMTGCSGCFDYANTQGRVNSIAIDPTTTTTGSIVAYIATVGGGVWKTTNCCSVATTWTSTTDDALVSTASVDSVVIDPNDHNTVYVGTGDLNYGSFSMGSQGILKSTNAGGSWAVLGASAFGAPYPEPAGQFPQYQAVGKVRVDPNNSNNVVAGTKTGLYLSYDGGVNWTGPCLTNAFNTQRQDITGLELTNVTGTTRILAAVGTRGFATTVQYDLGNNGANGLYKGTMPASGCPSDFAAISRNDNGFVFGTTVAGSPYATGNLMNATTGAAYGGNITTGNQLGRMDIAVAPSNPNYIYAQVGSIAANNNSGCGNTSGCQLGVWSSIDGGNTWTFMTGSAGGSLRNCLGTNTSGNPGDYPQNWYDQGMAVDPNDPDRVFVDTYDTWLATRTGTSFYNLTCGYNGSSAANHVVHVDHHALAFVPGSSSLLLEGSDGGIFGSIDANNAISGVTRNTWFNMYTGLSTIEFYSGDISGNFNTSLNPQAVGGAQDNGPSSATFAGSPTGPVQWQMGLGGDGFTSRIDPVGTGTSLRFWEGNNSGGVSRCVTNCTASGASWSSSRGSWTSDTQSFVLPYDIFHGGIPGGDDCAAAGVPGGCTHLIAGTTRVWETILGGNSSVPTSAWYVTNNPATQNMTKQTLGNRSYINQVKYSPKFQSVAILGTNDANVWIGFSLGTGVANQANWVDVTGGNSILPNRPVLGIALDPTVAAANVPVGYAAVGGFDQNTPTTPGHVFRVSCTANCASSTWEDKSGNLPNIPVDSIIVNPNVPAQVFAGTDIGLYYTNNILALSPIWFRYVAGLPNVMIWDMQIDRGATTLSLWTRGRGAFVWPLPTTPTASNGDVGGQITDAGGNPVSGVSLRMSGAQNRLTMTDALGNYHFDNVGTNGVYTITPSRANYTFNPSQRNFSQIGIHTDAAFTGSVNGGIVDPLSTTDYFVRQQYLDFLGREPDEAGLNFWTNNIETCGSDAVCRANKRTETSAAFFLSIEFQQTGYLVYRMYRSAYGSMLGAPVPVTLSDFQPDSQAISNGVVVNRTGWEGLLEGNKQSFALEFVQRARFTSAYPDSLTPAQFVDTLFTNAGVTPSDSDRAAAIAEFNSAATSSDVVARGRALRKVAENSALAQQEFNKAFVLMQYFGYLRRDPNSPPDGDYSGYNFWLNKLDQFGGDFRNAEMVKAFLVSGEYRQRFPR